MTMQEIESKIKDELKAVFEAEHTDTITTTHYKATYKSVTSKRVDTTELKKELPDVAEKFTKATTTKRFTIQ